MFSNKAPSEELLRLRGQIGPLRAQAKEAEQSRVNQMQMALAKLPQAELEFERLTKLHSESSSAPPN